MWIFQENKNHKITDARSLLPKMQLKIRQNHFPFFAFFFLPKEKKDELHYHLLTVRKKNYQDEIHKTWEGKEGAQMIT